MSDAAWRRTLAVSAGIVAVASAIVATGATLQARAANERAGALAEQVGAATRGRERLEALAALAALPSAETQMRRLRAHLPPDVALASVSRVGVEPLTLLIDAADPDLLRASLAADPVLRRLRERGQEVRPDGRLRVRLVGDLG